MSERSQATINARGRHESRRGSTDTTAPAPLHDSTMPDGALRLTPRQALRIRRAAGARPGALARRGGAPAPLQDLGRRWLHVCCARGLAVGHHSPHASDDVVDARLRRARLCHRGHAPPTQPLTPSHLPEAFGHCSVFKKCRPRHKLMASPRPERCWEHEFMEMLQGQHRVPAADVPANRPPAVLACMHEIMARSGAGAASPLPRTPGAREPLRPLREQCARLNARFPGGGAAARDGTPHKGQPLRRREGQGAREQMEELWRRVGTLEATLGSPHGSARAPSSGPGPGHGPGSGPAAGHGSARAHAGSRTGEDVCAQRVEWSAVSAWIRRRIRRDAAVAFKLWTVAAREANAQRCRSRASGSSLFSRSPSAPQPGVRAGRPGGASARARTPASSLRRTPGPAARADWVQQEERVPSAVCSGRRTKRALDMGEDPLSCSLSLSLWTAAAVAHEQSELPRDENGAESSQDTSCASPCSRLLVDTTLPLQFEGSAQPTQPEGVAEQCCNRSWGAAGSALREQGLRSEIERERARSAQLEEVVHALWGELTSIEEARRFWVRQSGEHLTGESV